MRKGQHNWTAHPRLDVKYKLIKGFRVGKPFLPLYTRGDIRKMSSEAQAFYNQCREEFSDE